MASLESIGLKSYLKLKQQERFFRMFGQTLNLRVILPLVNVLATAAQKPLVLWNRIISASSRTPANVLY